MSTHSTYCSFSSSINKSELKALTTEWHISGDFEVPIDIAVFLEEKLDTMMRYAASVVCILAQCDRCG